MAQMQGLGSEEERQGLAGRVEVYACAACDSSTRYAEGLFFWGGLGVLLCRQRSSG